jgi:coproporphyrinogen III oxidase-like Fe-S oxidoreductase
MLGRGALPVAGREELTHEQQQLESLWLGLRTREGIQADLVRPFAGAEKVLARLEEENLVEISRNRIIPTREGFAVADSLPMLFVEG